MGKLGGGAIAFKPWLTETSSLGMTISSPVEHEIRGMESRAGGEVIPFCHLSFRAFSFKFRSQERIERRVQKDEGPIGD